MSPQDEKPSWIESVVEGGLPQIVAGPAGKAISRLIGATVEVPAAYIDSFAQNIRDTTDARSKIAQAIGDKAAEIATNDPAIMDRALGSGLIANR